MSKYVQIAPRLHPESHHIAVETRSPVKVLEQTFFPTDADDLVQSYKLCSNLIALLRGLPYRLTQTSAQTLRVTLTSNQTNKAGRRRREGFCALFLIEFLLVLRKLRILGILPSPPSNETSFRQLRIPD